MPAPVVVTYPFGEQRIAVVRADVAFGDSTSDRFSMPGYSPVAFSVDGVTGAAVFTNAEMQALALVTDVDARMARVPGFNLAADGMAALAVPDNFEQAAYRFLVAATTGVVRVTATFARVRMTAA